MITISRVAASALTAKHVTILLITHISCNEFLKDWPSWNLLQVVTIETSVRAAAVVNTF